MLKRIVIMASYAQLLFDQWVPIGCTLLEMAEERCKSCGFLFGGVARVVGVCTCFSDVMLKRGVVVMEGKGCESCSFLFGRVTRVVSRIT